MIDREPTRILLVAACPIGESQLRLDHEVRAIQDGFQRASAPFSFRQYLATRPGDLSREVLKFQPQFFHFCGHGMRGGIILESATGGATIIKLSALTSLFALFADNLYCVVLNCCYSRAQALAIGAHIPFVIGMNDRISDAGAIAFSAAFYEALGEDKDVPFAFGYALSRIQMEGIPEDSIPELFTKQSSPGHSLRKPATVKSTPASQIGHPIGHAQPPAFQNTNTAFMHFANCAASTWPNSLDEISTLGAVEFELFCLSVVKAIYDGSCLTVKHAHVPTESGDRDSHYILNIRLSSDEQVEFRVWLEAKHQRGEEADYAAFASRLAFALIDRPHKIILATDRSFSRDLHLWVDEFVARTGTQCQLIDGPRLLAHSRIFRSTRDIQLSASPQPTSVESVQDNVSELTARSFFALSPSETRPEGFRQEIITAKSDRPIYLIVESSFSDSCDSDRVTIQAQPPPNTDFAIYPLPPDSGPAIVSPGERLRRTFVIWPNSSMAGTLPNPLVTFVGTQPLRAEHTFLNLARINRPILSDAALRQQHMFLSAVTNRFSRWLARADFFSVLLSAPPGTGKSRLIAALRRHCHSEGVSELFLDCESVSTDVDFTTALVRALLPVRNAICSDDLLGPLSRWCIKAGVNEDTSRKVASTLCRDQADKTPAGVTHRIEIASALLAAASRSRPLALFVEDLHKASPSLLALLTALISSSSAADEARFCLIASTRPFPSGTGNVRNEWLETLTTLTHSSSCLGLELQSPSKQEARLLLQSSVSGLEDHHAELVLDLVGTTPFAIREAVLFLLATDIATYTGVGDRLVLTLADPTRIHEVVKSLDLVRSTEGRIKLLFLNLPSWHHHLLLAGAVYGRRFPLLPALEALGIEDGLQLAQALETCSKWSIASPAAALEAGAWLEFDHDLVREAILAIGPSRTRAKVAKALLDTLGQSASPRIQCKLTYQAGMIDACLNAAQCAKNDAHAEGRVSDVIEFNQLTIQLLDPEIATDLLAELVKTGDQHFLDPAFRNVQFRLPPSSQHEDRMRSVLTLLLENIDCLCTVGSGSSGAVEVAISEARLIAGRLKENHCAARLMYFEGRMWFERNCAAKAIALHEEAEHLFSDLGFGNEKARAENLVRHAICLRKAGRIGESLAYLWRAARIRPPGDWLLINKIRNNFGAAYLGSDWSKVRFHWEKQIGSAERRGLLARKVHGLASLSFIDLFEGHLDAGFSKACEALEMAERLRLDNQIVRLCLDLGVHSIQIGNTAAALSYLLKAEALAIRHGIGRRLWRVTANLATAYELIGSSEKASARDLQTIRQLTGGLSEAVLSGRELLPVVNIILRERSETDSEILLKSIQRPVTVTARNYALVVTKHRKAELPTLLGNYCVDLNVGPRFLLTE